MLYTGFSRVCINPPMGIGLFGYYIPRYADGILDDLEINTLAVSAEKQTAVFISIDHCGIRQNTMDVFRNNVSTSVNLPVEAIFISATHTHTAPFVDLESNDALIKEYTDFVCRKLEEAAKLALEDLHPSRMGWGVGYAPNIAFTRRYLMKDGSVRTNPGVNNPEILKPLGEPDERVSVLRFDRDNADTIVLVSMGIHPDTVGGCKISADWPGFTRRTVEKVLDNTKCLVFNGVQGDVNHVKVHPVGGDLNDMFLDFDDVARGYGHARYMGRVITGAVLQVFDKVKYVPVHSIHMAQRIVEVPAQLPTQDQLAEARRIDELHQSGKDYLLPYTGMQLTTVVARSARMLRLEHGPATFSMVLTAISIGPVALVGIPGEPFSLVGKVLKNTSDWELVIPCINTNGKEGYFPTQDAYDIDGYEAASSNFSAGVAECIIRESQKLLCKLQSCMLDK